MKLSPQDKRFKAKVASRSKGDNSLVALVHPCSRLQALKCYINFNSSLISIDNAYTLDSISTLHFIKGERADKSCSKWLSK